VFVLCALAEAILRSAWQAVLAKCEYFGHTRVSIGIMTALIATIDQLAVEEQCNDCFRESEASHFDL
jgi:hypothetical protein